MFLVPLAKIPTTVCWPKATLLLMMPLLLFCLGASSKNLIVPTAIAASHPSASKEGIIGPKGLLENCAAGFELPEPYDHSIYFPWMAAIVYRHPIGTWMLRCSATIVAPSWVLCAAHCFYQLVNIDLFVHVGSTDKEKGQKIGFSSDGLILHPEYKLKRNKWSDIALVKLDQPLDFHSNTSGLDIALICVGGEFSVNDVAIVAGWGYQTPALCNNNKRRYTESLVGLKLRSGRVRIVSTRDSEECALLNPLRPENDAGTKICSRTVDGTTEQGDSGGPMLKYETDRGWHQLGISSYADCPTHQKPMIHTNVNAFCDWMAKETGNEVQCRKQK